MHSIYTAFDFSLRHIARVFGQQCLTLGFTGILLEDGCDIGAGAIILPGAGVGEGAIIGAGAVVTGDIPLFEVWAGVPAHKIRER